MEFRRVIKNETGLLREVSSYITTTALIAVHDAKPLCVLEYEIKDMTVVKIKHLTFLHPCNKQTILEGFIEELQYWHPYIKSIFYEIAANCSCLEVLYMEGLIQNNVWYKDIKPYVELFHVSIEDVTPEQLSVDFTKVEKAKQWITESKHIIISCAKVDNKLVCIDGYSRLMAAMSLGIKEVYAYMEPDIDFDLTKTCLKWCESEGIDTMKALSKHIVSSEEHDERWIKKCERYLNNRDL